MVVLLAQSVLWAPVLMAATSYTWVAAGAAVWTQAVNWSPNTDFPGNAAGDDATFNTVDVNAILGAPLANPLSTMTFTQAPPASPSTPPFSVDKITNGGAGAISLANGITTDPHGSVLIGVPITLTADQQWTATALQGSSNLTPQAGVVLNGRTLTISTTDNSVGVSTYIANVTLTGLSGTGALKKIGTGGALLSSSPAMDAQITVSAGSLTITTADGLGTHSSGPIVNDGATLNFFLPTALTTAQTFSLSGAGINPPLQGCGAALFFDAVGSSTISGAITLVAGSKPTGIEQDTDLTLSGPIGGAGGLCFRPDMASAPLVLGGANANTYTGGTTVDATQSNGIVKLQKTGGVIAVPSGGLTVELGSIVEVAANEQIEDSNAVVLDGFPGFSPGLLQLDGNVKETIGSLAKGGFGPGEVDLNSGAELVTGSDGTDTTFDGLIHESTPGGKLTKTGSGTFTLTADNTYTGLTTINGGTLVVNGNQGTSGASVLSGTLAGTGTVGPLTTTGGKVSPGPVGQPGILNVAGLADLSGSTLAIDINGTTPSTQYDRLVATGAVTLQSASPNTLSVTLGGGFSPAGGDTFTILTGSSVTGTFSSLPNNATFAVGGTIFKITYNPTSIVLTAVTPVVTIDSPAALAEGNSGQTPLNFTVTISPQLVAAGSVNYATTDGTATGGASCATGIDYISASGTLTLPAATSTVTLPIQVCGDLSDEPDETFTVTVSTPSGVALGSPIVGTGTIQDDDAPPTLTISGASTAEPASGTTTADFTVSVNPPSGNQITVQYTLAGVTATGGAACGGSVDFVNTGGTLTIPANALSGTISVTLCSDAVSEPSETYTVTLSSPTLATLGSPSSGTGTITDSSMPAISIGNGAVAEPASGSTPLSLTVTLSSLSASAVTAQYAITNGTSTGGAACGVGVDFVNTGGTVTVAANTLTGTIQVPVCADAPVESNETFTVTLSSPSNATLGTPSSGTGTITDSSSPPQPSIRIGNGSAAEPASGSTPMSFTVTLSATTPSVVTAQYAVTNGTATGGAACGVGVDFVNTGGIVTVAANTLTGTIQVPICADAVTDIGETFTVTLSSPTNATLGTPSSGTGTIIDFSAPPPLPTISIGDATTIEGDTGSKTLSFTVTASAASGIPITAQFSTANGTATGGATCTTGVDFMTAGGTATIPVGQTTTLIPVTICSDGLVEGSENFQVNLASPTNATIADGQGIGTITDDDAAGSVAFNTAAITVNETAGAATITVQRSGVGGASPASELFPSGGQLSPSAAGAISVNFATANGTATAGQDYTATAGILNFGVGEVTKTISVPIANDGVAESAETFTVTLSGPTGGATLGSPATITVTITDVTPAVTPPADASPQIKQGDDDTDKPRKETEEQQQQRQHTNTGNKDDVHTEGNVLEVHQDQSDKPPYVLIANKDGTVRVNLLCGSQCPTIQVGDYLEADGEKQNEQLFDATDVAVKRKK